MYILTLESVISAMSPDIPLYQGVSGQSSYYDVIDNAVVCALLPFSASYVDVQFVGYKTEALK